MAARRGVLTRGQGAGNQPIPVWSGTFPITGGDLFGLGVIVGGVGTFGDQIAGPVG
jgi:hypothetical protein